MATSIRDKFEVDITKNENLKADQSLSQDSFLVLDTPEDVHSSVNARYIMTSPDQCPKVLALKAHITDLRETEEKVSKLISEMQQNLPKVWMELQTAEETQKREAELMSKQSEFERLSARVNPVLKKISTNLTVTPQTDFHSLQAQLTSTLDTSSSQTSLQLLTHLKQEVLSHHKNPTDGKKNVLKKIDEYVQLEAKRKETVGTIEKLIKFTK